MRIFILANGKATRWENYMGVDKQLIVIDGEPLLNRTVRLLKENETDDFDTPLDYDTWMKFVKGKEKNEI